MPLSSGEDPREAIGAPVDPLSPDQSMVLNDANARKDLWGRVRTGFGMPTLDNDLVREHERWYASRPDYVKRMTERGSRYLFHVLEELERRKMPTELALLPFIESAFNPQAMSSARASGMWQFMPLTGKDYDLKQNMFRDDRRDVLASTRAALDYLGRLNKMFNGDWQLSLAAYNWGEGNVKRAIARNERAGLPTDYESLNMPAETRHYVPKFQAVKNIVTAPQDFGLSLPHLENHPYFVSVPIRRDMDVTVAARLAGMSLDDFKAQPADEQAGHPGRRHAAGAAALRQRGRFHPSADGIPRTAGKLDRLDRAQHHAHRRSRAPGRHERGDAARDEPHPAEDAHQGGLHPARPAQRASRAGCARARGRQRAHGPGARRAAAAQGGDQGAQG